MYARTYACPGATDFFLFIYFHTEVRKAIRSMNLLSTFVFLFVFMCIVYVYAFFKCVTFTTIFLIYLLFRGFFISSVIWFSYFSFCPIIIRSLTFSLLDHSTPVLPRIPRFLSLLVALFPPPPLFSSRENYPETRESKRDREVRRGGI